MNLFYKNNKHHTIQFSKYFIAGTIGVIANILLLYILADVAGLHYLNATFISFISGIFIGFILQKFWTFSDNNLKRLPRQLSLYSLIAVTNLFLNLPLMYLLVDKRDIWYINAQIIVMIFLGIVSYVINTLLTFRKQYGS